METALKAVVCQENPYQGLIFQKKDMYGKIQTDQEKLIAFEQKKRR